MFAQNTQLQNGWFYLFMQNIFFLPQKCVVRALIFKNDVLKPENLKRFSIFCFLCIWTASPPGSRTHEVKTPHYFELLHKLPECGPSLVLASAVKRSIGSTTGFHNHGEGPY